MLLTGFCLGCLFTLFISVARDFRRLFIAKIFLALLISASAFLIHDYLPESVRWVAGDIMTMLPALFWLLCVVGFSEYPSLRTPFTAVAIISFVVPAISRPFGAENSNNEMLHLLAWQIPQICEYIVILHGMWTIFSGWKGDLVEIRRRVRAYTLGAVGVTALCVTFSLNMGLGGDLPLVASALCCVACNYFMLSPKRGIVLHYETAKQGVVNEKAGGKGQEPLVAKSLEEIEQDFLAENLNALMQDGYYRSESLTLRRLAQKLDVPEHKLRALINQRFSYRSFSEYINTLRIQEASSRLVQEIKTPIQNIALDAGYRTMSSFNRAFRDLRNCTPTEYRVRASEPLAGVGANQGISPS
jgi:AraC-like DNA-binding protein